MSSRLVAGVVAGTLALGGAIGAFVSFERAVVRISVTPTPVRVEHVTLNGDAGRRLATTQLQASATNSITVASSKRQLPATFAAGYVSFWCSPMTSCPNGYTVPAGTLLGSVNGEQYYTLGSASFPSCQPSSPVAIRAATTGGAGNAGAGTVLYGAFPSYIHVTNPGWIGGGSDARSVPVVQQSDIDSATASLTSRLDADLRAQLHAEAGLLSYLPVGAPAFVTTSSARAGDTAPSVTVTVTGTLRGVAFSTANAESLLRSALLAKAPAGFQLGTGRIETTYSMDPTSGEVKAAASGLAVPAIDANAMTLALRGESLAAATARLERAVPGSAVTIRTTPVAMPWLPMLQANISLVVVTAQA